MRSRLWETGGRRAPNTGIRPTPIPHYMTPQHPARKPSAAAAGMAAPDETNRQASGVGNETQSLRQGQPSEDWQPRMTALRRTRDGNAHSAPWQLR